LVDGCIGFSFAEPVMLAEGWLGIPGNTSESGDVADREGIPYLRYPMVERYANGVLHFEA